MDKIRLACGSVEQDVDMITECIVEGDNDDVKSLVPAALESLRSSADNCAEWSREIVEKFRTTLDLLEEVHISCHASQMTNGEKLKELERRRLQVETQKEEDKTKKITKQKEVKELIEKEREEDERLATILKQKQGILDDDYDLAMIKAEQDKGVMEMEKAWKNRSWWNRVWNVKTGDVKDALKKEEDTKQKAKELEIKVTRDKAKKNEQINHEKKMLEKNKQNIEGNTKNLERKHQSLDEIEALTEKISAAIVELASTNVQKHDFEGIKELLRDGIKQIAELEKRWKLLEIFFTEVANGVEAKLNGTVKKFVQITDTPEIERLSKFRKKKMMELAFAVYSSCNGVNSIATSYLKISTEFLMPSIVEMGTVLALDSEQDAEEIKQKTVSIQLKCKETVEYINEVVKYAKLDYADQVTIKEEKLVTSLL